MLLELLASLDFVNIVKKNPEENKDRPSGAQKRKADFFSFAGLWADRDINIQSIRRHAWPERYP
jgi:hypothetical protein